jgi:mannose-6-phosphate isomerase-like protein (cupin superfamily)
MNGMNETERVRRVVTGHDPSGKAIVVEDTVVEPTAPDFGKKWSIWASDAPPALPNDGAKPSFTGLLLPKPGGLHVILFTLPARFNPDDFARDEASRAAAQSHITTESHPVVADPNPPGSYGNLPGASRMHATASVDCLMQVSGESVLVLEDSEVRLRAGDWLVVNGVMHSWRNDLEQPAVMVGVVYGSEHRGAPLRPRKP